jgi:hypothetical protein
MSSSALVLTSIVQNGGPPWWGVPVLAGAFTVLGAILSQTVTLLLARSQAKREDATRWHSNRLKAYSALLLRLNKVYDRLIFDEHAAPIEPEAVFDVVEPEATNARLLATPDVDRAISDIIGMLATVADRGWDNELDHISMSDTQERLVNLRRLMRAELGVPSRSDDTS